MRIVQLLDTAVGWLQIFFNVNSNDELAFHAIVLQALSNQNLVQVSLQSPRANLLLHALCVTQGPRSCSCLSCEHVRAMTSPFLRRNIRNIRSIRYFIYISGISGISGTSCVHACMHMLMSSIIKAYVIHCNLISPLLSLYVCIMHVCLHQQNVAFVLLLVLLLHAHVRQPASIKQVNLPSMPCACVQRSSCPGLKLLCLLSQMHKLSAARSQCAIHISASLCAFVAQSPLCHAERHDECHSFNLRPARSSCLHVCGPC